MTKLDLFAAHRERMNNESKSRDGVRKYWRSVESRRDGDQTQSWLDEEFPHGLAPAALGDVTHDGEILDADTPEGNFLRRDMLKIMGASMALAGASACVRRPEEEILPYVSMPEDIIPGVSNYYATAMPSSRGAVGLLVESHEGRPTKIEGNPDHPSSLGAAGLEQQASILNIYDPDRSKTPLSGGNAATWSAFDDGLLAVLKDAGANGGEGLAFMLDKAGGPTEARLLSAIGQKLPKAKTFHYDPLDLSNTEAGSEQVFGPGARAHYALEKAMRVCAVDSDFLADGAEHLKHARGFMEKRRTENITGPDRADDEMNRLYAVEPTFSTTGASADNRLRVATRNIPSFLLALASELNKLGVSIQGATNSKFQTENKKFVEALAKDLKANSGRAVVLVGERQPAEAHALAHHINAALGAFESGLCSLTRAQGGKTVTTTDADGNETATAAIAAATGSIAALTALIADLNAGKVKTLVMMGVNPKLTAPPALGFAEAMGKAKTTIHMDTHANESAQGATWHVPLTHYLEAWGDAVSYDGVMSIVQPLVKPLFGARTHLELLASFAGEAGSAYDLVKRTHESTLGGRTPWRTLLHKGVANKPLRSKLAASPSGASLSAAVAAIQKRGFVAATAQALDIVFRYDPKVRDGRNGNNAWCQELPDPMTKLTWENALVLGPSLARELGIKSQVYKNSYQADEVTLTANGQSVKLPVFVLPGMGPASVEITLGYGRGDVAGYIAKGKGVDVSPLLDKSGALFANGTLTRTGNKIELACTQDHFAIDGEPVKEGKSFAVGIPLQDLKSMNDGLSEKRPLAVGSTVQGYLNDPMFAKKGSLRVVNEGLVEKDALKQRPGGPDKPIQPTSDFTYDGKTPMNQMFAAARINGKPWGEDQQWGMVVDMSACTSCNACVIACQSENNIPVVGKDQVLFGREMHWMRIDRYFTGDVDNPEAVSQPINCLHCENAPCEPVCPVAATVHGTEGINSMVYNRCIGTRYCANNCPVKVRRFNYFDFTKTAHLYVEATEEKRHKVLKLQRNPNVSVRFRGVMEKCTYCTQRINEAKMTAKRKGEDSKHLPDGAITPACAQTCPTSAITFGNINDEKSRVSKLKRLDRNYEMLSELNIRPRTSYLARLKNPNTQVG